MIKIGHERIGEAALLKLFQKWLKDTVSSGSFDMDKSGVVLDVGDDCAVIKPDACSRLLISADLLVEDVHFRNIYFSPAQLGYKALAVNISDIAAMGGFPSYALIGLAIPKGTHFKYIEDLYDSLIQTGKYYGVRIIGGDTVGSPGPVMLGVTILGSVKEGDMITRSGAMPGDRIMITGNLGAAALGLEILENKKRFEFKKAAKPLWLDKACERLIHPVPRLKEARALAKKHLATSMIDLSDSLSQAIGYICQSSGVGARIIKNMLPISPEVMTFSNECGKDPCQYALTGGEDYEMLFTVRTEDKERASDLILNETGITVTDIGEICHSREDMSIMDETGGRQPLIPIGFDHFLLEGIHA
ncbi:thiamine-phosphate kinase [bacterium]|nr:thiamine-phosphate kinase [bacterium]